MPAPAPAKETPTETLPLEERIRRRAYELYLQRGNQPGSDLDDWFQAEEEIRSTEDQATDGQSTKRSRRIFSQRATLPPTNR